MKKYVMQETAEEIKFGDMIVADLSKDMPNGNVRHYHLACKFIPEIIPLLLEEGIIKEVEEEEPKEQEALIDFTDDKCPLDDIVKQIEDINCRINQLKKVVLTMNEVIDSLYNILSASQKPNRYGKKSRK